MSFRKARHTKMLLRMSVLVSIPIILLLCLGSGRLLLVCDDVLDSADVIVVLGYRTQRDGQPSEIMQDRVQQGVNLYLNGYAPRLLFTGGATRNGFVEAEVMADLAIELGVPPDAIVKETLARNTIENARFSADIMRERGWRSAIIVTSPYHTQRAVALFRKQGINVVGCAAASDKSNWLVQIGAIVHEFVNWLWYFCAGIL